MHLTTHRKACAALAAAVWLLSGCGGGSGSGTPSLTTPLTATVIDGAIQNALVCLDKNRNGACDNGEPQGRTNATGKVTLDVANDDIGKYPVLAVVGTDAVDADHGPVTTAFVLSAPADQPAVVSPITTLVQQLVAGTGASTAEAAATVQGLTGLSVSVFTDYSATPAPTSGTDPGTLARMLVVAAQEQTKMIAAAEGTTAVDGKTIALADLHKAVQNNLLERLPSLVAAATASEVVNAALPSDKEAALRAAAVMLASDPSALTLASIATVVAINNQAAVPPADAVYVPEETATLGNLSFTDAANYYAYLFTATLAQDTPDANNNTRYVNRQFLSVAGNLAIWSNGSQPKRQADLNWNGSAWVACPINFEGKWTVPDAQGYRSYVDCDMRTTGRGTRATFDIAGKTMMEVYESIVAAGDTSFRIANAAAVLGDATFPAGSKLYYTSGSTSAGAITYEPTGKDNPPGLSNAVAQYSPAITAGGDTRLQAPGTGCNSDEGNGTTSTTLEGMIAAFSGNPCISAPGNTFTYQSVTYTNPDPTNEAWFAAAVSLGNLGTAKVGSGPAPGFYTGNIKFRVAFKGSGTNPTTYYACKERFNNGSTRNCSQIGTGTYTIATLGDARVMTFNDLPAQMAPLSTVRVFVERAGAVYYGFAPKPAVVKRARLTTVAAAALLNQLGLPAVDPNVPVALTAGSYQGTWDARAVGTAATAPGTTIVIKSDGNATCQDTADPNRRTCLVTITNPATGAFTVVDAGRTLTGMLSFATGSGTFDDPSASPGSGSFVIFRR